MKNIAGLMKQAAQMQKKMEEMQARLETLEIEGSAGAGMVTVMLNGKGVLKSVRIDPKLADPAEMEMLQDLIVAAHAEAKRKLEATTTDEMQKVTGGLNLPGGMKLPF
jgi:hypothetical protein